MEGHRPWREVADPPGAGDGREAAPARAGRLADRGDVSGRPERATGTGCSDMAVVVKTVLGSLFGG